MENVRQRQGNFVNCKGCEQTFEPTRINQQYHNEACKQKAYRERSQQKRNTEKHLEALRVKQYQQKLCVVPCTIDQANAFVQSIHRHHGSIPIARLAFAVADESGLIRGVAIIGRPCNTYLDDNWTLEVRRVCTDGCSNACSALYGAAWKAVKAIGYRRLVTYTLPEEGGSSLRAVGWKPIEGCGGKAWSHKKRERKSNPLFLMKKTRWEVCTNDFVSAPKVAFPSEALLEAVQEELHV